MNKALFLLLGALSSPVLMAANPPLLRALQQNSLIAAVQKGDITLVKRLLAANTNPNQPNPNGATALHYASFQGILPLISVLLAHGAAVGISTSSNKDFNLGTFLTNTSSNTTPLMLAGYAGNFDAIVTLLEAGAAINALDSYNQNVLTYVLLGEKKWPHQLSETRKKIIKLLLDYGANPLVTDSNGLTPRYYYAQAIGQQDDGLENNLAQNDPLYRLMV
jgi:ankyrin repeat protein